MENEGKDSSVGISEEIEKQVNDSPNAESGTENAAEKYEEFAGRSEETDSSLSDATGEGLEKDFFIAEKKRSVLDSLLNNKKKIIVIALLLVLIAAGAFYFLSKKEESNTAAPVVKSNNGTIIDYAMTAMQGVQSYSFDGTMSFRRALKTNDSEYSMNYNVTHKGVSDKGTQGDSSAYSSLAYNTVRSAEENKRETGIGLDSAIIGGKKYLKLNNLSIAGASNAATLENGLKDFSGSWYLVSEDNYKSLYTEVKDYAFLPADLNLFDVESVDDFNEIFNHKVLTSPQNVGSELTGDGAETIHYDTGLSAEGAVELVVALSKKNADMGGSDEMTKALQELQSKPQEAAKFKKMVDYVMQKVSIEIWIGKSDNLVHRFRVSGDFNGDDVKGFYSKLGEVYGGSYSSENGTQDEGMSFNVDYTLSDFNSAKVREPEGAKDFAEVMEKLKSINPNMAVAAASSSALDTDVDGLSDEQEKVYGSDASKPDTDGDGYKDGDEIKNGYDPIVAGSARLDYNKLNKK
ncbi:MAG: hypothetical protein WCQ96_02000 [Patescibacteria group bacterium]